MPPIFAPLPPPTAAAAPGTPPAAGAPAQSPIAEAVIPPAPKVLPAAPVSRGHAAAAAHPAKIRRVAKVPEKRRPVRLAAAHRRPVTHRVAARMPEPALPPGTVVAPPGYEPPGPYERFVESGPPRGLYGGWGGYRGRYPYFP